jgi:polyisoprenoid-binding protein YceI
MSTTTKAAAAEALPAGTWNVDPAHSSIEFQVKHMGLATVKGQFNDFDGQVVVGEDGQVRAQGTVKVASVDTRAAQRDEHLRSPDFFDAETHPELAFRATDVNALDEATYRIAGELTIRGETREVVLEAVFQGTDVDPWGNTRAGLEVVGQLDRHDFGLTWNQALESGGVLVGRKVKLVLDLSLVKA